MQAALALGQLEGGFKRRGIFIQDRPAVEVVSKYGFDKTIIPDSETCVGVNEIPKRRPRTVLWKTQFASTQLSDFAPDTTTVAILSSSHDSKNEITSGGRPLTRSFAPSRFVR